MLIRRKHRSHRRTMRRLSTNSAAPVALHGIVLRAGGGAIRGLPGAMAGPDNIAVVFVPHAQDEAQLQCCKRTDPSVAQLMSLKRCSGGEAGTPQVKAGAESRRKRCMTAQDACALLKRLTRVAVRSECGAWHISAFSRHALHQRKHVCPSVNVPAAAQSLALTWLSAQQAYLREAPGLSLHRRASHAALAAFCSGNCPQTKQANSVGEAG